jgi:hypothetical protein
LPDHADITGAEVALTAGHSAGGRLGLYLLREGATTGRWKTVGLGTHVVSCDDTWTRDYGGPSDLWSTTWSADEVNDWGFGLRIASGSTDGTRFVRAVSLTVYYDLACEAASVTGQPVSFDVTAGETVVLSIDASGTAPLHYRWEKRTTGSSWEVIPGATSDTFTISEVVTADAGEYRAIVSNACGESTSETATVTVAKRTPELSWTPPDDIVYGTPLSGTQLNATADADGSYHFAADAGAQLSAGLHTLTVQFVPDDVDNVESAETQVEITVQKADAAIDVLGSFGVYDGEAHGATGSATGVDGCNLSAGLELGDSFVNVPGGTAFWSFSDPTGNHNDASGSVDIVLRGATLHVTAEDQSKRFDEQPFIGFTVQYRGFRTGDGPADLDGELVFGDDAVNATHPGRYAIRPGGLSSPNYEIQFVPGTLSIAPAYHASPVEGAVGFADGATLGGGGALQDVVLQAVYEIGEPIRALFVVTDFYGETVTDAGAVVSLIGGEVAPAPLWYASAAGYNHDLGAYLVEISTDSFWGSRPQPGIYVLDITLEDGSHYQETLELVEPTETET